MKSGCGLIVGIIAGIVWICSSIASFINSESSVFENPVLIISFIIGVVGFLIYGAFKEGDHKKKLDEEQKKEDEEWMQRLGKIQDREWANEEWMKTHPEQERKETLQEWIERKEVEKWLEERTKEKRIID